MIINPSSKIVWTNHALEKRRFYRLSESRLIRILRHPARKEIGVAPRTVAVMQPAAPLTRRTGLVGRAKSKGEIWLMYETRGNKVKIISAWRYPGISPVHEPPPIPDDIKEFLNL